MSCNIIVPFIDLYISNYLSRNIGFAQEFASCLAAAVALKPKQLSGSAPAIVELEQFLKRAKVRGAPRDLDDPPDINYMEALLANCDALDNSNYIDELKDLVTYDMFKLLNILHTSVKCGDSHTVESVLAYIFSVKQLSLADLSYPEVAGVKFGKNDIVWYLWRILLLASATSSDEGRPFVRAQLAIYTTLYQKKHRLDRLPILIHTFRSLTKGGLRRNKIKETTDVVAEPGLALGELFKPPIAKVVNKQRASKAVIEEQDENVLKYEYLRVFTHYPVSKLDIVDIDHDNINEKTLVLK